MLSNFLFFFLLQLFFSFKPFMGKKIFLIPFSLSNLFLLTHSSWLPLFESMWQRQMENSHLLAYSPNIWNTWTEIKAKNGTWNAFRLSNMAAGHLWSALVGRGNGIQKKLNLGSLMWDPAVLISMLNICPDICFRMSSAIYTYGHHVLLAVRRWSYVTS